MTSVEIVEFDRQVGVLVGAGIPDRAGLSAEQFASVVAPLRDAVVGLGAASLSADGQVSWVLVVSSSLVPAEQVVPLVHLPGGTRPGVVDRNHGDDPLSAFAPLPVLEVPDAPAYLLLDVDRGDEFRSVRPRDAVPEILGRQRTPLTIHEGLSFALQFPGALAANHCFMLAGSRRADKRVPALWISDRTPKLGWCWEGNHHTWLGIASAGGRRAGNS